MYLPIIMAVSNALALLPQSRNHYCNIDCDKICNKALRLNPYVYSNLLVPSDLLKILIRGRKGED